MKKYTIKVDGKYYTGEVNDESQKLRNPSSIGWYTCSSGTDRLLFSEKLENARILEGHMNMRSKVLKLFDDMRYGDLDAQEIVVEEVNE